MKIKLAEALLRRKELNDKVAQLKPLLTPQNSKELFEVKVTRKQVHEGIDDVIAAVPKLTSSEVTAAYDWHARQLRMVDAAIQQANWNTEITVDDNVMQDYKAEAMLPRPNALTYSRYSKTPAICSLTR